LRATDAPSTVTRSNSHFQHDTNLPSSLDDVLAHLEATLRTSSYDDRTGNGLLVRGRPEITRIGAALNTSFTAIDAAIAADVDLLIVHHAPWESIDLDLHGVKLERLRAAHISLYAAHEALDRAAVGGVGGSLAKPLELIVEREGEHDLVVCAAPGMSFEARTALVAERLNAPVRAWPNNPRFTRIAVVPGGGGSTEYLAQALALGCDTFLTGEGSLYTELFAREHNLSLVFATHGATEFPAVCAFVASVATTLALEWRAIRESPDITGGGRAPIEHGWATRNDRS
jgi:putative NIF3 family GTP cyclohydrolase 1 type 2